MEKNSMQNISEREFYKGYYANIKHTESELLTQITSKIKELNVQSDSKMVEHVVSRIKMPESAIDKLKLAGYEPNAENAVNVLSDVIGIRLITHFIGDIYAMRNILVNSCGFDVVKEKDYVKNAKPTGYRGYHIIIQTNIDGFDIKAEIQLRTIAMDCWASLEHQIRYKKGIKSTKLIDTELKKCSDDLMSADIAMEEIWSMVKEETDPQSMDAEDLINDTTMYI
jgi:putative GTP pyrophosphokinase